MVFRLPLDRPRDFLGGNGDRMTNQEKKRFLKRYSTLNQEINRTLAECEQWRAKAEKITPTYSALPKSQSQGDRIVDAVEHIVALENKMNADIDRLIEIRNEIEASIRALPYPLDLLMKYKYIDGLTWEEIAVKMNYSYRNVTRMHGKALVVLVCPIENQL